MSKSYYDTLEIDNSASQAEIKAAFRKLSKKYHPDINTDPGAEDKFKEINEAYNILSDPDKKAKYDMFGTVDDNMNSYDDFSSIFSGFGGFGGFGNATREIKEHGEDLRININISMEDMLNGCTKKYKLKKDVHCKHCHGSGSEDNETCTCSACSGTGRVREMRKTGFAVSIMEHQCDTCHGTGRIIKNPCKHCSGTGLVKDYTEIEIKIPKGMPDGGYFILQGEGSAGPHRGIPGNLIVICHEVTNDKNLKREGNNLLYTAYVPYKTLVLGGEIEIPYITGYRKIKIKESTKSGSKLYFKEGFPDVNTGEIGDYIVTVECLIPDKKIISSDEIELIKQLKNL